MHPFAASSATILSSVYSITRQRLAIDGPMRSLIRPVLHEKSHYPMPFLLRCQISASFPRRRLSRSRLGQGKGLNQHGSLVGNHLSLLLASLGPQVQRGTWSSRNRQQRIPSIQKKVAGVYLQLVTLIISHTVMNREKKWMLAMFCRFGVGVPKPETIHRNSVYHPTHPPTAAPACRRGFIVSLSGTIGLYLNRST